MKKVLLLLMLSVIGLAIGLPGLVLAGEANAELMLEGYYECGTYYGYQYYMCFYPDGHVMAVSSGASHEQLKVWFNRESALSFGRGTYTIVGNNIFGTHAVVDPLSQSVDEPVTFYGTVNQDGSLSLHKFSHINGNESDQVFRPFD